MKPISYRNCGVIICIIFVLIFITGESVPADETLPFTERNGLKYINVHINNVPLELVFDTGANDVVLNSDALRRLGVYEIDNARKVRSHTAGGVVEGYTVTLNSIRAGNIQKKDYEISYVPSSMENLLGATFLAGYSYYVDEDNKVIRLVPKGGFFSNRPDEPVIDRQSTGPGLIEVEIDGKKYIREGNKLIPRAQVTPKAE